MSAGELPIAAWLRQRAMLLSEDRHLPAIGPGGWVCGDPGSLDCDAVMRKQAPVAWGRKMWRKLSLLGQVISMTLQPAHAHGAHRITLPLLPPVFLLRPPPQGSRKNRACSSGIAGTGHAPDLPRTVVQNPLTQTAQCAGMMTCSPHTFSPKRPQSWPMLALCRKHKPITVLNG
jgi:hypothetical protein